MECTVILKYGSIFKREKNDIFIFHVAKFLVLRLFTYKNVNKLEEKKKLQLKG